MSKSERITRVFIPLPAPGTQFHFEKVSRRQHLDIASVNTAMGISVQNETIHDIHLAAGGVAPVPLYLEQTALRLRGRLLEPAVLKEAMAVMDAEISPISDMRGSAGYKRRLLRNLFLAHFLTLFPGRFADNPAFLELPAVTEGRRGETRDSQRSRG